MSQVTIVDDVLNFTEVNSTMHSAAQPSDSGDYGDGADDRKGDEYTAKTLNEEEQRMVHERTSILISGRLPQ